MRVLGIDYGTKRVGYASSDAAGRTAFPGGVIAWREEGELLAEIARVAKTAGAERIVVGLPIELWGREGIAAGKVRAFVEKLREVVELPVETFDERLSTVRAQRAMLEGGASRAKRAQKIDAVAAALFLQTYLDREGRKAADGGG